jgi:hypothetical protein
MGTLKSHWARAAAALFLLAGPAGAADIAAPPEVEPTSYTYFSVEGGYIHLDSEGVQAYLVGSTPVVDAPDNLRERTLDISEGFYGRAEVGHGWGAGLVNGIGAYVQGWEGDSDDVSETGLAIGVPYKEPGNFRQSFVVCVDDPPCAAGEGDVDRSLIEVGIRLFHDYGETGPDRLTIGIEPFVAFIDEDTSSTNGVTDGEQFLLHSARSSELDAEAYGALLALDLRHSILERTALIGRIAGGAYYVDADADARHVVADLPDSHHPSQNFWGLRAQLAAGIEQMLTEAFSIAVIGRLDYWSDYPTMDWPEFSDFAEVPNDNSIASEDFLALSIGGRISVNFR